jgi:hypothetical protein
MIGDAGPDFPATIGDTYAAVAAALPRSEPSLNQGVIEPLGCHNPVPIFVFPD